MLLGIDAHWSTARACVPRASLVGSRGQPSRRQRGVICKARPPVNPPRPLDAHAAPPPPQPPNLQELASDSWYVTQPSTNYHTPCCSQVDGHAAFPCPPHHPYARLLWHRTPVGAAAP